MTSRPLLLALALLIASFAFACNGGGDDAQNGTGETTTPTIADLDAVLTPDGTSAVETVEGGLNVTPVSLEQLHANLQARLETIGVNVGAVPEDVRDQLVNYCLGLRAFVEDDEVDEICATIAQAIEQGNPELIELVLNRLDELTLE